MAASRIPGSRARFREYLAQRESTRASAEDRKRVSGGQRSMFRLVVALWEATSGRRWAMALSLGLLTLGTLIKLIPPAATKLVIDHVLTVGSVRPLDSPDWLPFPESPRTRLLLLVATVFAVSIVGVCISLWSRWIATRTSKHVQLRMRRRVFEHAARLPLHRVHQLKSGGAASLLREDAGGVGELLFSMLYYPWRAVIQFLGGFGVLLWVDWRLLIGAVGLIPFAYFTNTIWERRIRPLHRDVRKRRQEVDSRTTEAFGGMRVVRAFGRQRRETSRFVVENHVMARQELHIWWISRGVEAIWDLFLPAASGFLLLIGGAHVLDGRMTLGDLMMFLVYLAMLLEPLAILATSVTQFQSNLAGFDRVLDVLEEPRETADSPGSLTVRKASVRGGVTFIDVGFRYPGGDRDVLDGIDLEVKPGETIALVGRSGAGKTTLCNLVARFHDPTRGAILVDGLPLREIRVENWRRVLGVVEQDVFLFDGTVAENIAYADRRASLERIERAAEAAYAAEFINALPNGFDTFIGERGVRLSGGQRQRIAIARAILADPRVLILDEATSNLDSESERAIQLALAELMRGRTAFVIAHRLSTIRSADRILLLDQGRIVELGTHDELMSHGGIYRGMVELQAMGSRID
ncbi:MAG: ABC transporter ATP-binding protein [Isosphaeraceae bacterium]|nr:ABC transporter ATP-binding protein [Isosphaeraceae bacterium]